MEFFQKCVLLVMCFSCLIVFCNGEYNCEYKKDGFYSDEDFCHIYWRCNYGVAEEYECPAGTAWNHVENRCDWLDNVDCSRIEAPKADADEDEDAEEESKKVVETTKRPRKNQKNKVIDTTTTTPIEDDDLETEAETKTAVLKLKSALRSRELVTNSPNNNNNSSDTSADIDEENEEEKFDYDDLCSNDTLTGYFRDDPFVCNKYIRCNHGYAQKFKCYRDTAWDIPKKTCLWIQNVDCGQRELITDEKLLGDNDSDESVKHNATRTSRSTRTTTTTTTTTTTVTTTTVELTTDKTISNLLLQTISLPLCQSFGSYFIPDNSNCASYYMCNNGKETKMSCTDKQLFNAETSQCEEFQQVFCGSRPVNLADRNQCSSKRDGIYPDIERGCKIFYQCINQQKVREASCPSTFKFNSLSGRCDNPVNIVPPCGTYGASSATLLNSSFSMVWINAYVLITVLFINKIF